MRFFIVGITLALLAGLTLGAVFSSELRGALRGTNGNFAHPTSTIVPSGGAANIPSPSVSRPASTTIVGTVASSSPPPFRGPTSQPYVIGPSGPPPGSNSRP